LIDGMEAIGHEAETYSQRKRTTTKSVLPARALLRAADPVGSAKTSFCARVFIGTNAKNVGAGIPTLT
jgi:hypothetical protein